MLRDRPKTPKGIRDGNDPLLTVCRRSRNLPFDIRDRIDKRPPLPFPSLLAVLLLGLLFLQVFAGSFQGS